MRQRTSMRNKEEEETRGTQGTREQGKTHRERGDKSKRHSGQENKQKKHTGKETHRTSKAHRTRGRAKEEWLQGTREKPSNTQKQAKTRKDGSAATEKTKEHSREERTQESDKGEVSLSLPHNTHTILRASVPVSWQGQGGERERKPYRTRMRSIVG